MEMSNKGGGGSTRDDERNVAAPATRQMQKQVLSCHAYACLLRRCGNSKALAQGKLLHARILASRHARNAFLGELLVEMYGKCGRVEDARAVFDSLPRNRNDAGPWNFMIVACNRNGQLREALHLYGKMIEVEGVQPDSFTLVSILGACAALGEQGLAEGERVHAGIVSTPLNCALAVQNALVHMYAKCGHLEMATKVFSGIQDRDVCSWTTMITAYAQKGHGRKALDLYQAMNAAGIQPNQITFVSVIGACASVGALEEAQLLHARIVASGCHSSVVQNALVSMYARCNQLDAARQVFDRIQHKDVVSWNAMIAAYSQQGDARNALDLYKQIKGVEPDGMTFSSVLCACANSRALEEGKAIHACIRAKRYRLGVIVETALINMYAKCGRLDESRELFDQLENRNLVSWNVMILAYAQQGHGRKALDLYEQMDSAGMQPNDITFVGVLGACSTLQALELGKPVHTRILANATKCGVIVETALLSMYAKCGRLDVARSLFEEIQRKNVACWNAMIAAYTHDCHGKEALDLYEKMQSEGVHPDAITFTSVLAACSCLGALKTGEIVHARIIANGFHSCVNVQNALLSMYAKCGKPDTARSLFDSMESRDVVSWNAMIAGYVQSGYEREALDLYSRMDVENVQPDSISFASALAACSSLEALELGKTIHAHTMSSRFQASVIVQTALVTMYAKCGQLDVARALFDSIKQKNVVSWNAMVAAYAQHGEGRKALDLYQRMHSEGFQPDAITFTSVLGACASLGALEEGKAVHSRMEKCGFPLDVVVETSLINMYAKCGELDHARMLFKGVQGRNVVSWNALITSYVHYGRFKEALDLYEEMDEVEPDDITFASVLGACASLGELEKGKAIHARILAKGVKNACVSSGSALVTMYARCAMLSDASKVFGETQGKGLVYWNAMIGAYARHQRGRQALDLYGGMSSQGLQPDAITFASILGACSVAGALDEGKAIHADIDASKFRLANGVQNALVDMYVKCGSLDDGRRVFDKMVSRDLVSWNALIAGYAQHEHAKEILDLYQQMVWEGVQPDHITFLSILAACSQAGMVEEGRLCFVSMSAEYGVIQTLEHYVSMIDLLGRAGRLNEAEELAECMPFEPDAVVWTTLLGACRIHGDVHRAEPAAEHASELEPDSTAPYILLSNTYAAGQSRVQLA